MNATIIIKIMEMWCANHSEPISIDDLATVLAKITGEEIGIDDLREMLKNMVQAGVIKEPKPGRYTL